MRKKTKKQPYRNALLKLNKERSSLDSLYKENQRLNANLLYKREEAQTLLKSAAQDKEKAEKLRSAALQELKQINPYHPDLFNSHNIDNATIDDALRYRMASPVIGWNDNQHMGMVRLTCYKQYGKYETVAYGFSEALIKNGNRYISEKFIDDLSKSIALELTELATKKMKEWCT